MSSLPQYQPIGNKHIGDDPEGDQRISKSNDRTDGKTEVGGKTKIDSNINLKSKFRANRFLRVHLHLLKSLYDQEPSTQSTPGDDRVEIEYWGVVEEFLVQRNAIKRTAKRTQRMREIQNEAEEFQKKVPAVSFVNNHLLSHQVSPQLQRHVNRSNDPKGRRPNFAFGPSSLLLITQPSPHYLPNRRPRGWNGRGCISGGPGNSNDVFGGSKSETREQDTCNPFGMVSGLLKLRHKLASRDLNRRTSKLGALVKECRSRIESLSSELSHLKAKEKSIFNESGKNLDDFILAKEECEECEVRIETKIALWKLLLHDLSETISVQS